MRSAAAASIAIHVGLIAGAWAMMSIAPPIDELAAESVSVDIISMDAFSEQPSEMVTTTNQNLVSGGAEEKALDVPETAEVEPVEVADTPPVDVAEAEPTRPVAQQVAAAVPEVVAPRESEDTLSAQVMTATVVTETPLEGMLPQIADASAAIVVDTVAPSTRDPLDAVRTATLAAPAPEVPVQQIPEALVAPAEPIGAIETASLAPAIDEPVNEIVPVPRPRIVRTRLEPKVEPVKEPLKPAKPLLAKEPEKSRLQSRQTLGTEVMRMPTVRPAADRAGGKAKRTMAGVPRSAGIPVWCSPRWRGQPSAPGARAAGRRM